MKRKSIGKSVRFEVLKRDGFTCQYCGASAPQATLHLDHIIPVSKGGSNSPDNLVAACVDCNVGKGVGFAFPPSPVPMNEVAQAPRGDGAPPLVIPLEVLDPFMPNDYEWSRKEKASRWSVYLDLFLLAMSGDTTARAGAENIRLLEREVFVTYRRLETRWSWTRKEIATFLRDCNKSHRLKVKSSGKSGLVVYVPDTGTISYVPPMGNRGCLKSVQAEGIR